MDITKPQPMKASELRIGNILEFSNGIQPTKIVTVGRIFFSSAAVEKEDGDFEITPYYRPIPLTEEWLVKFGFEKSFNYGCSDNDRDAWYWTGHKISLTIDLELSSGNHNYSSCLVEGAQPLRFVHQLQNLYFALTGEELNI